MKIKNPRPLVGAKVETISNCTVDPLVSIQKETIKIMKIHLLKSILVVILSSVLLIAHGQTAESGVEFMPITNHEVLWSLEK